MSDTPAAPTTPLTDESLAEYVRHHQCWNADPNVTIADWHRGVRAIEAEARASAPLDVNWLAEQLRLIDGNHDAFVARVHAERLLPRIAARLTTTDEGAGE